MQDRRERCLILASRSPRRQSLLAEAGWVVNVIPADVDESWPSAPTIEHGTCELALRKARAVASAHAACPVLAADTVVVLDGDVIGKPSSEAQARAMLARLSGQTHDVVSGVALVLGKESWTGSERSRVTFRALQEAEIDAYLKAARYEDKAGAYGIQEEGGHLVERWEGRLDTIVGLPMITVESLWSRMKRGHDSVH